MTNKPRNGVPHSADLNLTFLMALLRRFPHWAIWLPQRGQWTAIRARYGNQPMPEGELVWVQAPSAQKLCSELKKAERRLRAEAMRQAKMAALAAEAAGHE